LLQRVVHLSPDVLVVLLLIGQARIFKHELEFTVSTSHRVAEGIQSREVRSFWIHGVPLSPLDFGKVSSSSLTEKKLPWELVNDISFDASCMSHVELDFVNHCRSTGDTSTPFLCATNGIIPGIVIGRSINQS
jgi:hypothetical protein